MTFHLVCASDPQPDFLFWESGLNKCWWKSTYLVQSIRLCWFSVTLGVVQKKKRKRKADYLAGSILHSFPSERFNLHELNPYQWVCVWGGVAFSCLSSCYLMTSDVCIWQSVCEWIAPIKPSIKQHGWLHAEAENSLTHISSTSYIESITAPCLWPFNW